MIDCKGCLLPLELPPRALVIGNQRFAVLDPFPSLQPALLVYVQDPGPNYAQALSVTYPTYQEVPALAELLLTEGRRMGITMKAGQPELPGKEVTYRVKHGRLGSSTIKQRLISSKVRCALINHEFIHMLQHLQRDLWGVPPLDWTTEHSDPILFDPAPDGARCTTGLGTTANRADQQQRVLVTRLIKRLGEYFSDYLAENKVRVR